jgi:hypothetical protein
MVRHRVRVAFLITILLTAIVAMPTTLALIDRSDEPDDLLSFILTQNEKARKNLATVSYKFELQSRATFDLQGTHLPAEAVRGPRSLEKDVLGEEFKKGKWRYSSMEQQDKSVSLQTGQTQEQSRLERAVFNDDYAASWHVGNIYAYQFDHESLSAMSERAQAHMALQSIDPIEYGFGNEAYTLMELYQTAKDKTRFTAEKSTSDGRSVFHIKQFSSDTADPDRPACVYTLDPEKGFLITRFRAYHGDGTLEREYEVQVEKIPGYDIWLPTKIQEKAYRRDNETSADLPKLRKTLAITITDIEVNEPIEDARFTLAALNLPDKVQLMRQMLDGETVPMVKKDGVWLAAAMTNGTKEAAK